MPRMTDFVSSPAIRRYNGGKPVVYKDMVPYEADLVFNAGVVKYNGKYLMLFRDDYGYSGGKVLFMGGNKFAGTHLGFAVSDDGYTWSCMPKPFWNSDMMHDDEVMRVYDPRLTIIDGRLYLCFACDTKHGLRGGVGVISENLSSVEVKSLSVPDNRNMALFPQKIGDYYCRLERPLPVYSRDHIDRFDMWMSFSPDLCFWGNSKLVLTVEDVPFANDKIGPAAPPVLTDRGWLTIFHAVHIDHSRGKNGWEDSWQKCYTAGVMLLDRDEPWKVTGLCRTPLIAPETYYETEEGFRTNVIFPGGLIVEDDGSVKIYYGASDTFECLAESSVDELVSLCLS